MKYCNISTAILCNVCRILVVAERYQRVAFVSSAFFPRCLSIRRARRLSSTTFRRRRDASSPFSSNLRSRGAAVSRFRYLNYEILRFKRASRRNFQPSSSRQLSHVSRRARLDARTRTRKTFSSSRETERRNIQKPVLCARSHKVRSARTRIAQSQGGLLIGGNGVESWLSKINEKVTLGWVTHGEQNWEMKEERGMWYIKTIRRKRAKLCHFCLGKNRNSSCSKIRHTA